MALILVSPTFLSASDSTSTQEGYGAEVDRLVGALKDADVDGRRNAAEALGKIGGKAEAAVPALIVALNDQSAGVRMNAAETLGKIGEKAEAAVPALIDVLNDQQAGVRNSATTALINIGKKAEAAVPVLIDALNDHDWEFRARAAEVLGKIGEKAKAAVPALIDALKAHHLYVRARTAKALGKIGEKAEAVVPALADALNDQRASVRMNAAGVLENIGEKAEAAVPALSEALKDQDVKVRASAVQALGAIATSLRDAKKMNSLPAPEIAHAALANHFDPSANATAPIVRRAIEYLSQLWWRGLLYWTVDNKGKVALATLCPLWLVTCLFLLWLQPSVLLTINNGLRAFDFKLPKQLGEISISLRYIFLVGFFDFRPRLLDAWVRRHVTQARSNFERKRTVDDRSVHIPIPVELDGEIVTELHGSNLRKVFSAGNRFLLIWGEGGVGKTSIACQIARWGLAEETEHQAATHLMLPVLIERELDFDKIEGKSAFIAAIRDDLENLIDASVPEPLLNALLEKRRILVIIDHLSELSTNTRQLVRPDTPGLPTIAAFIITSRIEETLGNAPISTPKPMRVEGNRLSSFMEAHLTKRGKRQLFDDPEYFDACKNLSMIVGDRDITILFAKLYAEQMIAVKEGTAGVKLPDNIPDLMLSYLKELNRDVYGLQEGSGEGAAGENSSRLDDRAVHQLAKLAAWECLASTYRPAPANRQHVIAAFRSAGTEDDLQYLEDRLRLIETVEPAKTRVRFVLDPLAEYLAGLHLVERYGEDGEKWNEFLAQADTMEGGPEAIKGFLLAVYDCTLARQKDEAIPEQAISECARRAGFNPAVMEEARHRQRVKRYASQLSTFDPYVRRIAAEILGQIGNKAEAAMPALIHAMNDEDERVRNGAAFALRWIGEKAEATMPALIDALKDEDERFRQNAAFALGEIGQKAEAAVPGLTKALADQDVNTKNKTAKMLQKISPKPKAKVNPR